MGGWQSRGRLAEVLVALDAAGHFRRARSAGREVSALVPAGPPGHVEEGEIARALTRAAVYRLLGTAFARPSPSTVAAVAEAAELAAPASGAEVATRLRALAAAARASAPDEVARAYVNALERPTGCSPYEGSYGAAPLLAGKGAVLADIAGFYAAFGMTPGSAEVEDHIAAELEFMSVLALKEAAALAEGLDEALEVTRAAESAFLGGHLGRWGASFAEALNGMSTVAYYANAAELLADWVAADLEALGLAVSPLEVRQAADPEAARPFACPMAGPELEGE
jgi:TorA maturation chaperone TorD